MTSGRLTFICREPQDVMTQVIGAVLSVLRPKITAAWIDAIADGGWYEPQRADVNALLAIEQAAVRAAKRRKATGTGIDLDMTNDAEFGLLVRLAAYSINAEAWADADEVFSSSDTGDHAWFSLTPQEATDAASRLDAAGLTFESVLLFHK